MKSFVTLLLLFIFIGVAPAQAQNEESHDIALENVSASRISKRGTAITVKGTMRNIGEAVAQNPMIRYSLNGGTPQRKLNSCKIAQGETFSFSFTVPTKDVMEDGDATLDIELAWRDGTVDDNPDDNTTTLRVYLTSDGPNRRMVCEEGTGDWCGWCVKGIVGLHKMVEKYGDRFIPIAVHTGRDVLTNDDYAYWITDIMGITSYPTCWLNRERTGRNPNFTYLEPYMVAMPPYAEVDVDIMAEISEEAFDLTARVTPLVDMDKANRHIVFAITEDGLPGVQQNFYYDGNSGEMGGFESLPMYVELDYEYVARGMWPSAREGSLAPFKLPSTLEAGQSYDVSYSIPTTAFDYKNLNKCSVIAMIVDTTTGCVLNARKRSTAQLAGVNSVIADTPHSSAAYSLSGQRISTQQHGVSIENGKKVLR